IQEREKDNSTTHISANNPQSEMQLICSICEEVLKKPVTTPCGHNFCMDCIREYWESKVLFQCPQCKEKFPNISELKVNTKLSKMVAEFWNPFLENNTSPQDQCLDHPREVSHDICVGREVKAVNSSFEASYCETPLEPNQRVATLRRQQHVENLEEQERHGRCLEFKTDNNEVQVKGNTLWSVGVARESINRTIHAAKPKNGLWTIQLGKGNVYRACTADPTPLSLKNIVLIEYKIYRL
uniref:RING-type domain-containing protein n=1 Tax=Hucho hucho TaxID=62062 RepID=A0A4W5NZY0_9TELE